jgi:Skp family chaperone for outer membrane proteins
MRELNMKTIIAVASLGLAAFGTTGMAQAETAATPVQDVVITAVSPQDQTTVELTAVLYDARIHASGA